MQTGLLVAAASGAITAGYALFRLLCTMCSHAARHVLRVLRPGMPYVLLGQHSCVTFQELSCRGRLAA